VDPDDWQTNQYGLNSDEYHTAVENVDNWVMRLVNILEEREATKETLVVVTSDRGLSSYNGNLYRLHL